MLPGDLDQLAQSIVDSIGLSPSIDPFAIAAGLDIPVYDGGRCCCSTEDAVFLAPMARVEQRNFGLAHELAHVILRAHGEDDSNEAVVDLFALALLMPAREFGASARAIGHDLGRLKRRFRSASHRGLALRLLTTGRAERVWVSDTGPKGEQRRRYFSSDWWDGKMPMPDDVFALQKDAASKLEVLRSGPMTAYPIPDPGGWLRVVTMVAPQDKKDRKEQELKESYRTDDYL